ncbi:MAG: alpha/beta fold hydrolase [Gammaproteobacteria bacterium]|nr:alpha/beta fold hydrolase [Gammaproteobacteria bacterium]MCF6259722.1 alpha/beta fold hydrolase [Gammaproteobacteria bacterium]
MNGIYIPKLIEAFHKAGIKSAVYLDREKWSEGQYIDALVGVFFGRDYDPFFPMLLRIHPSSHKQFNLIGYSYGSLIAAQLAAKYARHGSLVDHLVLIGSPISKGFLTTLRNMKGIKNIIIINLDKHGDPIYAGMEMSELVSNSLKLFQQMQESKGHFYYAGEGAAGNKRRKELAKKLHALGLR